MSSCPCRASESGVLVCVEGWGGAKQPERPSYQRGEFQQQGERRTQGIPAATGFIYAGKGVERGGGGSGPSLAHARWGSGRPCIKKANKGPILDTRSLMRHCGTCQRHIRPLSAPHAHQGSVSAAGRLHAASSPTL